MNGLAPVLQALDVRVYYNEGILFPRRKNVAGPFTCSIDRDEIVGLAGPSGSGKTSLGKALLGLLPTWEGRIRWNGTDIRENSIRALRSRYGWIGQEPMLAFDPRLRIVDTLRETLKVNGLGGDASKRIRRMCDEMNLDRDLVLRRPFELSPGQVQRCSLIRVFLLEPLFVLLDEPTSSLDPINQAWVFERIFDWRREHGLAILLISHSRALLSRLCGRVVSPENGE
jgi:peptide/nickel transport system ATP-binding protein